MKKIIYGLLIVSGIFAIIKILQFISPESHTTNEWAEMPDKVSIKNKWYVVSDFRTDNEVSIPRFKFGDGKTLVSKLPFVTAAIVDNDVEKWDETAMEVGTIQ